MFLLFYKGKSRKIIQKRGSRLAVFSETIKIVLRNVELEKMTTIKIVPTSEIWPPEAVLKVPRPALTIITKKPRFFCRIVKIKISERLLGVGSSAFDMFQMTFQFVRIRGISIIRTLFPYDFLYTPSKLFFKVMFLIENLCF